MTIIAILSSFAIASYSIRHLHSIANLLLQGKLLTRWDISIFIQTVIATTLSVIVYLFLRSILIVGDVSHVNIFGFISSSIIIGFFVNEIILKLWNIFEMLFGIKIKVDIEENNTATMPFLSTQKIENKFEMTLRHEEIEEKLKQLLRVNAFEEWCKRTKKDPAQIISQISNNIIDFLAAKVKPYYANEIMNSIKNSIKKDTIAGFLKSETERILYRQGQDKPFQRGNFDSSERFRDEYNDGKNPYHEGFIVGCKSVEGNTEEICKSATD